MKVLKDNHGFTLVEILATMAILIILMGVGAAAYTKYRKDSLNNSSYSFIDIPNKSNINDSNYKKFV